ncbi:MAG: CapA family protein [Lachnospiraceae bacterium]|nr:CapA family protein [Lachnospiraceae bacterium]
MYKSGRHILAFAIAIILVTVFSLNIREHRVNAEETLPSLNEKKLVLKPGKKTRLSVVSDVKDYRVRWSSADTSVATVSKKGKVTAAADGKTNVFAVVTYNEKTVKLKCRVIVESEKTVKLAAVGDALIHENILNSGKQKDGSYNYDAIFEHMKDYLSGFDVKIINQETIFVYDSKKFGGYPSFGTPKEVGDAMRAAGFNVITCATNHAYDRKEIGIQNTLDYWRKYKDSVLVTGIYGSQEDYDTLAIREYNGIKIAFLNYTTLLNSGAKKEPYYIRMYKEAAALKEIQAAKKKADFVIVLPHWGVEYEHEPSEKQEKMAKKLAEAGADAIIGCHPHVVQPVKVIKTSDGRRVPCYYSLGNFVSNMFWFKCQLEGLAELEIVKWNGETTLRSAEYTPIVNHMSKDDTKFTVYLLSDYTDAGDLYKDHYMNHRYWMGNVTPERLKKLFNSLGNEKY